MRLKNGLFFLALSTAATIASSAGAYVVKHTSAGETVRWRGVDHLEMRIDPSLRAAVADSPDAIERAMRSWNERATGAPKLSLSKTDTTLAPGYDGVNAIVYRNGYEKAGKAIAITILTYDEKSGDIVDADIVVNGKYAFGRIGEVTRDAYDLVHVSGHELGHTLGLGDEGELEEALMFGYTKSGDMTRRNPGNDDIEGVTSIYATEPSVSSGCTSGPTPRGPTGAYMLGLVVGGAFWIAARKRNKFLAAIPLLTIGTASLVANAAPTNDGPSAHASENVAMVKTSTTVIEDGMFKTKLTMVASGCQNACEEHTQEVWGGRLNGLVQEVAGERVPSVGEQVQVTRELVEGRGTLRLVTKSPHVNVENAAARQMIRK